VHDVLEILTRQHSIFGEEMKVFAQVLNRMLFCQDSEFLEGIESDFEESLALTRVRGVQAVLLPRLRAPQGRVLADPGPRGEGRQTYQIEQRAHPLDQRAGQAQARVAIEAERGPLQQHEERERGARLLHVRQDRKAHLGEVVAVGSAGQEEQGLQGAGGEAAEPGRRVQQPQAGGREAQFGV
jgi:hypothetical protein